MDGYIGSYFFHRDGVDGYGIHCGGCGATAEGPSPIEVCPSCGWAENSYLRAEVERLKCCGNCGWFDSGLCDNEDSEYFDAIKRAGSVCPNWQPLEDSE